MDGSGVKGNGAACVEKCRQANAEKIEEWVISCLRVFFYSRSQLTWGLGLISNSNALGILEEVKR